MDGVLEGEQRVGVHGEQRRRRWALATGDQAALSDTMNEDTDQPQLCIDLVCSYLYKYKACNLYWENCSTARQSD